MRARAVQNPYRYAVALTLNRAAELAVRLLPFWRGLRGLGDGLDGWRAARAAESAREAQLDALVARLGWTREALPAPDGWAGTPELLTTVAEEALALRPRLVVEFGSGLSTLVIARALQMNGGGRLISFDHNPGFADLTRSRLEALGLDAEVRAVELVDAARWGYGGEWYDAPDLPGGIDLLVIDGPPAWLRSGTRGAAAPDVFPKLASGAVVLLDDADRDGERANAERWRLEFPEIDWQMLAGVKGILRGVKAR